MTVNAVIETHNVHPKMKLNFDQVWQQTYRPKKKASVAVVKGHGRVRKHQPQKDVRLDTILGFRKSLTMVTSTWSEDEPGPIAFCITSKLMKTSDISAFNAKHLGKAYIIEAPGDTHFMDASTTIELWRELYALAAQRRRKDLGLPPDSPVYLLADAFSGNHATSMGEDIRRHELKTKES